MSRRSSALHNIALAQRASIEVVLTNRLSAAAMKDLKQEIPLIGIINVDDVSETKGTFLCIVLLASLTVKVMSGMTRNQTHELPFHSEGQTKPVECRCAGGFATRNAFDLCHESS